MEVAQERGEVGDRAGDRPGSVAVGTLEGLARVDVLSLRRRGPDGAAVAPPPKRMERPVAISNSRRLGRVLVMAPV